MSDNQSDNSADWGVAPPAAPAVPLTDERAAFEAWIRKDSGDLTTFGSGSNMHYRNSAVNNAWTGWHARAVLSAAPVVPLTDEQIEACIHHVDEDGIGLFAFARAIEKAHGIGGGNG